MASKIVITFICIFLALSIGSTNGQGYSFITNAIVKDLYNNLGFSPENAPERWAAEGVAIDSALKYIDDLQPSVFSARGGIEFIVGTTGGNTSTYICGLTKRLGDNTIAQDQIPAEIHIVYTLNYISIHGASEYTKFKKEVSSLTDIAWQRSKIMVHVRNYRPVTRADLHLEEKDYPKYKSIKMETEDIEKQIKVIDTLHDAVNVPDSEIIGRYGFKSILGNLNVHKIVDGVVGSGEQTVTKDNQMLLAIPTAQIGIMSEAIWTHNKRVIVVSIDNPSGMDQNGDWTIDMPYPVDYILSCVWHKKLVNSDKLLGRPKSIVLDITFRGQRLMEELQKQCLTWPSRDAILEDDVNAAIAVTKGVVSFKLGRMLVILG